MAAARSIRKIDWDRVDYLRTSSGYGAPHELNNKLGLKPGDKVHSENGMTFSGEAWEVRWQGQASAQCAFPSRFHADFRNDGRWELSSTHGEIDAVSFYPQWVFDSVLRDQCEPVMDSRGASLLPRYKTSYKGRGMDGRYLSADVEGLHVFSSGSIFTVAGGLVVTGHPSVYIQSGTLVPTGKHVCYKLDGTKSNYGMGHGAHIEIEREDGGRTFVETQAWDIWERGEKANVAFELGSEDGAGVISVVKKPESRLAMPQSLLHVR